MNVDEIREALSKVEYHDVIFDVTSLNDERVPFVIAERLVPDSRGTGRQLLQQEIQAPPPFGQVRGMDFYYWLFHYVILPMERHEAAEHFQVDGFRLFDPHVS